MQPIDLIAPVFVQVFLTYYLLVRTARARVAAVRRGEVKIADVALGQNAWPGSVTQLSRAYANQLELPMLFYVLVAFVLITSRADSVLLVLSWLFVVSRLWHAQVHTTHNNMRQRFNAFVAGVGILAAMWVYFGASLLIARFSA